MNLLSFSKLFLFLSIFAPVVVITNSVFPFIGGKAYFFRVAIDASLIFLLLYWAFQEKGGELARRLKDAFAQPLFVAVSLFVLMFLLASVFAHDPNAAFWSNYERGEGGFAIFHFYIFFALLTLLLRNEADWRYAFMCALGATALMILYGVVSAALWQGFIGPYLNSDGTPSAPTFFGRLFPNRFQGSLGNPAYVAPYLLFSMFYAAYLWITHKWGKVWMRNAGYGALIFIFLIFFVFSQTRGAFLGLAAGVLALLGYLIFLQPALRRYAIAAFAALALLLGTFFFFRETPFVQGLPGSRLLIINLTEQTAQTRFWTWSSAWQGFLERPLFGWGPENFSQVFDKYFDPRHYVPSRGTETWFDRAHSIMFDYLAETGIFGFLSYLGVFVVFYLQFWRGIRHSRRTVSAEVQHEASSPFYKSGIIQALFFGLPIAYLVQGLILFDVFPIYINTFFFLAFASYVFRHQPSHRA